MKLILSKIILTVSGIVLILSTILMVRHIEPFYSHYFLFAWWSYIGIIDAWLYLKGGESVFIGEIVDFITFLVPLSAFIWCIFELINLRIHNWHYIGVPIEVWIRWPGYFFAFGTVLPGIFLTANLLDHCGILHKNEFSQFFADRPSRRFIAISLTGGLLMLALPMLWPKYFFPLVWGGMVLLLDPINAAWGRKSLLQEWRQNNWSRTLQLLLAGFICGGLWEFWNFWAGAKWIYSVPLPEALLKNLKIFEMPALGFLGFPPFALECFVIMEFARGVREKVSRTSWRLLLASAFAFSLFMCWQIDRHIVNSFR